jgi:transcriptional regulator with XRE-family HTH domain
MSTLGKTVRRLRADSGLTQDELAQAAGISKSHVSRIESNDREPSLQVLRDLADSLSVWPGVLLAAFLEVEMPEDVQAEYGEFLTSLEEIRPSDQLSLPLNE